MCTKQEPDVFHLQAVHHLYTWFGAGAWNLARYSAEQWRLAAKSALLMIGCASVTDDTHTLWVSLSPNLVLLLVRH